MPWNWRITARMESRFVRYYSKCQHKRADSMFRDKILMKKLSYSPAEHRRTANLRGSGYSAKSKLLHSRHLQGSASRSAECCPSRQMPDSHLFKCVLLYWTYHTCTSFRPYALPLASDLQSLLTSKQLFVLLQLVAPHDISFAKRLGLKVYKEWGV